MAALEEEEEEERERSNGGGSSGILVTLMQLRMCSVVSYFQTRVH
jgi:hypothetical protein